MRLKESPAAFGSIRAIPFLLSSVAINRRLNFFIIIIITIDTEAALTVISAFLLDPETIKEYTHHNAATLIAALEIVMRNSILRFGDKYAKQLSGTAMGKPCAPCWAILSQGLDEN